MAVAVSLAGLSLSLAFFAWRRRWAHLFKVGFSAPGSEARLSRYLAVASLFAASWFALFAVLAVAQVL